MRVFQILFISSFLYIINAQDYYDLLGITKDADNRDIRRAFKKLALKLHPDKNKDDKNANENFIKINRAYEVLKDSDMRKKYDLHGEDGLKDDFGDSWKGNYQSWNYYYESFGIYDDDPEIITLSHSDFEQSVLGSPDVWFINFYSTQCSHCHHLAPAWRIMARELEGVIRIGAVNCEEDWMLCRQQRVNSYPSLLIYPKKSKYQGSRESDDMVQFIMQMLENQVIDITAFSIDTLFDNEKLKIRPWLILTCKDAEDCIDPEEMKKLSIILHGLVNIGRTNPQADKEICKKISCKNMLMFYQSLTKSSDDRQGQTIDETETKQILNAVLKLLPGPQELSQTEFEEIRKELQRPSSSPWLIQFDIESSDATKDTELKRIPALLPDVEFGFVNCKNYKDVCSSFSLRKYPAFIIFKPRGSHEFNHGRFTAHDIATFVRESLSSKVKTLSPNDFPFVTSSIEPWFIDFYAPWCPPCMQLLPEWRKVSRSVGHLVKFGTVDCTIHSALCNKYNIRSYPTTILYNQSIPHHFHGSHSLKSLEEFVKETLNPSVVTLDASSFQQSVANKKQEDMWVIDFYAPWCGPCQQLSPEWRKLAKFLKGDDTIHIGQVDCTANSELCSKEHVDSYPTIRLYPKGSKSTSKFKAYSGWHRDANSLHAWIYSHLPSNVATLDRQSFQDILLDSMPWIIDFYAPWCKHCQVFAPQFEKIAQAYVGKVHAGQVNCENMPYICSQASVQAYPTVKFYSGTRSGASQDPSGEEISELSYQSVTRFLEKQFSFPSTPHSRAHGEL